MKKVLALMLAVILALTCVVGAIGCGDDGEASGPSPLVVGHTFLDAFENLDSEGIAACVYYTGTDTPEFLGMLEEWKTAGVTVEVTNRNLEVVSEDGDHAVVRAQFTQTISNGDQTMTQDVNELVGMIKVDGEWLFDGYPGDGS